MIITLIIAGILVAGIVCLIVEYKTYRCPQFVFTFGVCATLLCGVALIVSMAAIAEAQTTRDVDYQNMLHKREMLEYRIEHMEENITGNEMLYNDIVEFNNELRSTKKWANNPWTSWFNNQDVASIDYIVLENLSG